MTADLAVNVAKVIGALIAAYVAVAALRHRSTVDASDGTRADMALLIDNLQEENATLHVRLREAEDRFDRKLQAQEDRFDKKLKVCTDRLDVVSKDNDQLKLELIRMRRLHGENGD